MLYESKRVENYFEVNIKMLKMVHFDVDVKSYSLRIILRKFIFTMKAYQNQKWSTLLC